MSKLKDRSAMNLNDFVVFPNSTAKSVKLNARNVQELKTDTGSLAKESGVMEENLNRLKERMSHEKEERAQSGSGRWQSGQQGPLNNATTSINPRSIKDSILQKISAGKVNIRVLQEEPLPALAPPPCPATVASKSRRTNKQKGIMCGQCEVRSAGVCAECSENYCIGCFSKFHQKGALKLHSFIPIQTELHTPVSVRDVVSSLSSSSSLRTHPNPSSLPATFSRPNPRPNSTHDHSTSSDTFADQSSANAMGKFHHSSQFLIAHPDKKNNVKSETEPSLLNGLYDEEESAQSFQEALRDWRNAGPTTTREQIWIPPSVTVADVPTQADLSPAGGGVGEKVPVRVEFLEHKLTLLDRLLLKKHRRLPSHTAGPKNKMFSSLSPPQLILSGEIGETKTLSTVCSDLSKLKPAMDILEDHQTPITLSTKPCARSQAVCKTSALLLEPEPFIQATKLLRSPLSCFPNFSSSLTSRESHFYPQIPPNLRTTFTLLKSSSNGALLPEISICESPDSSVKSSKRSQPMFYDRDAEQSNDGSPITPSIMSSRSSAEDNTHMSAMARSGSISSGDEDQPNCLTLQQETQAFEQSMQRLSSDLGLSDNDSEVLAGYGGAMEADSGDDMSCDSLELALSEEDCADGSLNSPRSIHGREGPARARSVPALAPAHEEGERDLPTDEAQQLSQPVPRKADSPTRKMLQIEWAERQPQSYSNKVVLAHMSWSDSDDSNNNSLSLHSDICSNLQHRSFDALHQTRTSLNSSISTELSEAEMGDVIRVDHGGCEDPATEADTSGLEVFTVAPGNSRRKKGESSREPSLHSLQNKEQGRRGGRGSYAERSEEDPVATMNVSNT